MDREQLVEAMAEAAHATAVPSGRWQGLLPRQKKKWRQAARAALAVAEPAVREWCAAQLITRADELRAMGTEKDTPDGVARECRSQSHALRVEAAILRTRGTP